MIPAAAILRCQTVTAVVTAGLIAACEGAPEESRYSSDAASEDLVAEIPSPAADQSGEPNLSVTGERVYLSWIEAHADSAHALKFAVLEGNRWSAPRTIATGPRWFVNWADFPSLIELPDGTLAAHWLVRSGDETYAYEVHVSFSRDGGETWSEPVVPHHDGTPTEHGFVSLFPAPEGDLALVWLDGRKFAEVPPGPDGEPGLEAEMTLRYATLGIDGALRDSLLLDDRACDCCQTGAALTSSGPVVVYRDRTSEEVRDIAVIRRVAGRWSEPAPIHRDGWVIPACPVNGPAIDAAGNRVAVAWFTAARDSARVRLSFSDDAGATWGPPATMDDGNPAGRVDVALLEDGSALVVWLELEEGGASVRARRVGPDGERSRSVAVATTGQERASGFPRLALAPGRAIFAWTDPTEPPRVRVATVPLAAFR